MHDNSNVPDMEGSQMSKFCPVCGEKMFSPIDLWQHIDKHDRK